MATGAAAPPSGRLRKPSLYVGDLHPEVTEMDLIQEFGHVAPVTSVRVCRDRNSLKSLCYGYVNFFHLSDASRALACLNHTELKGKTMRIMWCQRDPLARKNNIANLYVKNLVPSVTSVQLEGMFCKYGIIVSCKVAKDDNGKSRGFGFVQFDSEDSAMAALNALDGTMLEGKKLYVCKFMKKSDRNGTSEETFKNLYVKNLDKNISEDVLREKFSEYGKVCSIAIMKDDEGKSKGFGFVEFSSHEEAKNAVEGMSGVLLGSKNLFVGRAQRKDEREQNLKHAYETMRNTNSEQSQASNLYVKNLNEWIDDRKLEELFIPYGKVISAKVVCHDNGVSKGFGFVCFSSPEEAKKALESLNGTTVQGMSLYVALAQSPEERYRQFQRCQAPYSKQSFHASYWDILYPGYHPLYYNVPPPPLPISLSHLSLFQPNQYRNFGSSVRGTFTCGLQNPQEKLSTCLPHKQSWQKLETTKDLVCQDLPMKSTISYVSPQDDHFGAMKQQKPSNIFGKESICSTADASCRKSACLWRPVRSSPQGLLIKKNGKMLCPHLENIESEDAAKTASDLLEMGKPDLLEVLNSLNSLVQQLDHVLHLLQEVSFGSISDKRNSSSLLLPSTKSSHM